MWVAGGRRLAQADCTDLVSSEEFDNRMLKRPDNVWWKIGTGQGRRVYLGAGKNGSIVVFKVERSGWKCDANNDWRRQGRLGNAHNEYDSELLRDLSV